MNLEAPRGHEACSEAPENLEVDGTFPETSRLTEAEVRHRFAQAVQQGTPSWLWPDSSIPEWQSALREIERATRDILDGHRCDGPLRGDAEHMGIAAYTSGMGPLLGYWIDAGLLSAPPATEAMLALHYRHNSLRMLALAERASAAVSRLIDGGVKVTVLKGMDTAFSCFPAPGTRPTSDIDLAIPAEDKAAARETLRELCYLPEHESTEPAEQFWRHVSSSRLPQSLSHVHEDDPWGIDLHTSSNRRYAQGAPLIRFDELAHRSGPGRWPLCRSAHTLDRGAAILFLACHAGCHFSNLRLVRLVELILAIRKAEAEPGWTWNDFVELGRQTETLASAYAALSLAETLSPGTVPQEVLSECRRNAPRAVVRVVAQLSPATAHSMVRCTLRERYMWTSSLRGTIKQLFFDFMPVDQPVRSWATIFKIRFWRILQGRLSISSSSS